jgi:hypothetical protein
MHPFIYPSKPLNRPEHNHNYTPVSAVHNHATRYATTKHQYIPDNAEHFATEHTAVWNAIPNEYLCLSKLTTFKQRLKLYLLEKQKNEQ